MKVPIKLSIDGTFLTVEEAATRLGLAVASVRRYCNMDPPKILAEKAGRDWVIPPAEIERFRKARNGVGRPPKPA